MPADLIETSVFTAAVTVPEPGDDRTAESVETAFQALANRTRSLKDTIDNYGNVDHVWSGAQQFNGPLIAGLDVSLAGGGTSEVTYSDEDGTPEARMRANYYAPEPFGDWGRDSVFYAASTEVASKPLHHRIELPSGAHVTEVAALVRQGADATAGDPVAVQLWRVTPNGTSLPAFAQINTLSAGSDEHAGTAATRQQIEVTCDEEIANDESFLIAIVLSSSVAAPGSKDAVYWWKITWSDPGPRNY